MSGWLLIWILPNPNHGWQIACFCRLHGGKLHPSSGAYGFFTLKNIVVVHSRGCTPSPVSISCTSLNSSWLPLCSILDSFGPRTFEFSGKLRVWMGPASLALRSAGGGWWWQYFTPTIYCWVACTLKVMGLWEPWASIKLILTINFHSVHIINSFGGS